MMKNTRGIDQQTIQYRNPIINNHFDLVVLHVLWFFSSVNCCLLVNFPCNSVVTFVCAIWNTFWFPCSCVSLHCSYDICMTIGHATRAHFERINHTVDYVKSHLIAVKMERTKIIISHKLSEQKKLLIWKFLMGCRVSSNTIFISRFGLFLCISIKEMHWNQKKKTWARMIEKEKKKTQRYWQYFYSIYSTRFIYGFAGDFLNSNRIYKNVSISRWFSIQITLNLNAKHKL